MANLSRQSWRCLVAATRLSAKVQSSVVRNTSGSVLPRYFSLVSGRQQQSTKLYTHPVTEELSISSATAGTESLTVTYSDESVEEFPFCWLRDNCQCSNCYDHKSFTRRIILEDWGEDDRPASVQVIDGNVLLSWTSGHSSQFRADWLKERAFTSSSRNAKRSILAQKKEFWGSDVKLETFEYEDIVNNDRVLLEWLITMEKMGIAIIKNTPREPRASFKIVNQAGFVKPTHYGVHYPIRNKASANSLAYTDSKLGMHNDLPYCQYVPGIIFLHCITQFEGPGGENDIADGFHVAEYLRRHHPEEYRILTQTNVYFWNKGIAQVEQEASKFYKLLNIPLIVLNQEGDVVRVNNSQLRDSNLDVPVEMVKPWYKALRLYNQVIGKEATKIKLDHGETLVMDNTRLLHGRSAYNGALGERYMDQVYLDWDEALSKRRVLQEKYNIFHD